MVPFYRFEFPVDYFDNESFGGLVRLRAEVVFLFTLSRRYRIESRGQAGANFNHKRNNFMVANEIMSDVLDSSFLHDLLSDAHCAEVLAKSPVVAGKRGGLAKSKRPADESVNRPDERKLLVAEILKKTSDQEQLREFLCQTGENFASIREILQKMAGSKSKTALFDQCHFYLTDLKAVADTAGYERLGRFYDHWLSKVVARQREAAAARRFLLISWLIT